MTKLDMMDSFMTCDMPAMTWSLLSMTRWFGDMSRNNGFVVTGVRRGGICCLVGVGCGDWSVAWWYLLFGRCWLWQSRLSIVVRQGD